MICIFPAQHAHVPALKALLYRVWHQTYTPFLGVDRVNQLTDMWHKPAKLASEVEHELCASFVALKGEEVIGHALATAEGDGLVHLKRLYVDKEYHGQDVGKRLLRAALAAFPNGTCASLEVYENNHRAVAFYKRQGFTAQEKLRDEFAKDELYEFRMIKAL
ncbi:GNAT family N-acetyltransferase [Maritalea mediterranea]|uniref:GNAT family N-acetyltransferase n=1 Tax=Maritalea mediterranea TaxID=2909667 RepID=A0ABS9EEJ0_9HYPH|nr:N-acetyltransferase [Maritalea mediterranea]MCF4099871.1 GNAT family N-acetyltransferase [Maritalea mediterranea]